MSEEITLKLIYEKLVEHDKRFDALDKRIDDLEDHMNGRFAALAMSTLEIKAKISELETGVPA